MEISYSYQVRQALQYAFDTAEVCSSATVGTEHLLIGILKIKEAKLTELLNQKGISAQSLLEEVQILFGFDSTQGKALKTTSTLEEILENAEKKAKHHHEDEVSMDDLSTSLLERENNVALELLKRSGVIIEELIEELNQSDVFYGCSYLTNLNEKMKISNIKATQREKELNVMIHVLMRMEKSNCVLTGPAGVGKTALVEELARRIVKKQVPQELKDCIIAELNVNQMVAGTKYRGEFEKKMDQLMSLLKKEKRIILFIDELHLIVGAGKAEGSLDIASVLKPVLSRSDLRVIGATTDHEYEHWIQSDQALERRFVRIKIKEPDEAMTLSMLKEKGKQLSLYHGIKFQKGVLKSCMEVSNRLFPHLKFPDKAIDVLDMSCVEARCQNLQSVTLECVQNTALTMSQKKLQLDFDDLIHDLKKIMYFSENKILSSLNNMIELNEMIVWKVQCDNPIKEKIQACFQNMGMKFHLIHSAFFESMSLSDVLSYFISETSLDYDHIFWIEDGHLLRSDVLEMFVRKEAELHLKRSQITCSLAGGLIVLEDTKSSIGFFPEIDIRKQNSIEWIQIDENKSVVVS